MPSSWTLPKRGGRLQRQKKTTVPRTASRLGSGTAPELEVASSGRRPDTGKSKKLAIRPRTKKKEGEGGTRGGNHAEAMCHRRVHAIGAGTWIIFGDEGEGHHNRCEKRGVQKSASAAENGKLSREDEVINATSRWPTPSVLPKYRRREGGLRGQTLPERPNLHQLARTTMAMPKTRSNCPCEARHQAPSVDTDVLRAL